jgi:endonuclease G
MKIQFAVVFTLLSSLNALCIEPQYNKLPYIRLEPVSVGEVVIHNYYTLAYSEKNEQALWVFYLLTSNNFNSSIDRSDDFRADPLVKTGSATPADYKDSGTDRGHLCPAADMKINETSISESFYMSNMSPQLPGFNRGTWNRLEALVREWALIEDSLFIVTGPVFKDNLGVIGANNVTIPGYYYKVIYDPTKEKKMIAFLLRNSEKSQKIQLHVVPTDSIEKLTGIDFFAGLPDEIENRLEKKTITGLWPFDSQSKINNNTKGKTNNNITESIRCKGIAKSTGNRCKTMTKNPDGYCEDHQKQAPNGGTRSRK